MWHPMQRERERESQEAGQDKRARPCAATSGNSTFVTPSLFFSLEPPTQYLRECYSNKKVSTGVCSTFLCSCVSLAVLCRCRCVCLFMSVCVIVSVYLCAVLGCVYLMYLLYTRLSVSTYSFVPVSLYLYVRTSLYSF